MSISYRSGGTAFGTSTGTAIAHYIAPSLVNLQSRANQGEVGMGGLPIEDPEATLTTLPFQRLVVQESACSQPVIFMGWTADREYARSVERGMFVGDNPRQHDVSLLDLNAALNFRVLYDTGANRPEETWLERLTWLVGSDYLDGICEDTGYVAAHLGTFYQNRQMDAADYRGQYPEAVLNDLVQRFPAQNINYFLFWDTDTSSVGLFIDPETYGVGTATISISNDPDEANGSTVFAPDIDAVLKRNSDRTYSEVLINYGPKGSRLYRSRASTEATYVRRGTTLDLPYTSSSSSASDQAEGWLTQRAREIDTVNVTITVPRASAGLVRAGMLMNAKFTHLPGYTTTQTMRVASCAVRPLNDAAMFYVLELELCNPRTAEGEGGEPDDCDCGDGILTTGAVGFTPRTIQLGPIYVDPGCTVEIIAYQSDPFLDPSHEAYMGGWWETTGGILPMDHPNLDVTLGAALGTRTASQTEGNGWNTDPTEGSVGGCGLSGETFANIGTASIPLYLWVSVDPSYGAIPPWSSGCTYRCYTTGAGSGDEETEITPAPGSVVDDTPTPAPDGSTTVFGNGGSYSEGSLIVWVSGIRVPPILVEQTDPAAGEFELAWAPDYDELITTSYIAG